MKILRWALGVLIVLWALFNLWPLHAEIAFKAHWLKHMPHEMAPMAPLIAATPWWMLGLWSFVVVLLLISAWRLFRGARALPVYALAVVAEFALWWLHSHMPSYAQAFTAQQMQYDYYILAGDVAVGVLIWLAEGRKRA